MHVQLVFGVHFMLTRYAMALRPEGTRMPLAELSQGGPRPSLKPRNVTGELVSALVQLSSAPAQGLDASLAALGAARNIAERLPGGSEHLSDDDKKVVGDMEELINNTILKGLEESHDRELETLLASVAAMSQVNLAYAERLGHGSVGALETKVDASIGNYEASAADLASKQTERDEKRSALDGAKDFNRCPPSSDQSDDVWKAFFEDVERSKTSFDGALEVFQVAEEALTTAAQKAELLEVTRDIELCDLADSLTAECPQFKQEFEQAKKAFEAQLESAKANTANHNAVYNACIEVLARLRFLLSKSSNADVKSDVTKFEVEQPSLPEQGPCDISDLVEDGWDPSSCSGRTPVKVQGVHLMASGTSDKCSTEGGYMMVSSSGDDCCRLTQTTGKKVVVNYTQASYTKYTFDALYTGFQGSVQDQLTHSPHFAFKPCDLDAAGDNRRGSSPEMMFVNKLENAYGYSLYNGAFGHKALYTDPDFYGDALPINGEPKTWEVTMFWDGSNYLIENWVVQGVAMPGYKGSESGCSATLAHFTPKIWSCCQRADGEKFGISNFAVEQGNSLEDLKPVALSQ